MDRQLRFTLLKLTNKIADDKTAARYIDLLEAAWRYGDSAGDLPECERIEDDLAEIQTVANRLLNEPKAYDMRICGKLKWSAVVNNALVAHGGD